jgi:uncharacterized membrane protein
MYNFYFFLIITALVSIFRAYNTKRILKKIDIHQEIIVTSVLILLIFLVYNFYNNKKLLHNLDKSVISDIFINSIMISISLYISGIMLKKENVFKIKSLQKVIYLIVLVAISYFVYKEKISIKTFLGVLLLILGACLIENQF